MLKRAALWLAVVMSWVVIAAAQGEADILVVDVTTSRGSISPYVYGANAQQSVVGADILPQAQALNLKFLRLGGGPSDQQDLLPTTVDFFMLQARLLGAEPLITVRLLNGSPEKAAELVRYANMEKGYNIRYWSIGNEPNFFVSVLKFPSYTTEDLNREWRAIAEALLAADPNIMLVGPDISQYVPLSVEPGNLQYLQGNEGGDPTDDLGKDWMREFLSVNGDLVDVVSIHRYPYPGGKPTNIATIEGLRANSREWDNIIPNLRQIIQETTGRDIPLAITEFNSNSSQSSGGEAGLDTVYNGIWMADVLGRFIRHQVMMAAVWDLQGSSDRSWGLMGRFEVRPPYYAYLMYTHLGTELLASESADPDVTITAARRDDGVLTLMVINLGPDEKTKQLQLKGFTPGGQAEVWRFDAEHHAEQVEAVDVSTGITVPGQSVTLYAIPAG
jgi:hypothetical protein